MIPSARPEDGAAPIELVAGLGLLVLPAALLVLSLPGWAEARSMGQVAAREAARVVATAPDPPAADRAARAVADTVAANHGGALRDLTVSFGARPAPSGPPLETVTVAVAVDIPAVSLPFIGGWAALPLTVAHTEPIDRYRSRP